MSAPQLQGEIDELRRRLEEAEETIDAIRSGAVDAFVVEDEHGERIYTLQTADRPYRVLVESMQQGALTLSVDGLVLFCNPRLATLLQRPRERLTGSAFDRLAPEPQRAAIAELLRRGRTGAAEGEAMLLRDDGTPVPVLLSISPLPPETGAAISVLVTDLTEHLRYEELWQAQAALHQADRRKDEFLATLAHELRNPLAPISNAVQVLHRMTSDDPKLQVAREVIGRQLTQMVRLIDDLLDVSRITLDKLDLRKQRVSLSAVIGLAVETCRPHIEQAGHVLLLELPDTPVFLDADATRLAQVFANLINNACKYTESGGRIAIRAGLADDNAATQRQAWVAVEDNGIGIAAEFLPRLFEKFSQVESALERSQGGLGVGLALAHGLIDLHGGSISAHSDGPGRGSRFVVRLPVLTTDVASTPAAAPARTAPDARPGRRILVVDDNRDSADSLATLLEMYGGEVRTAYDGLECVEIAQSWRPDIALLDIGMPKCNGYEACQRIRQQSWGARMVLIAQTGWGQDGDRLRAEREGFDAHVVKPVEPEGLLALIDDLLAQRQRAPVPAQSA